MPDIISRHQVLIYKRLSNRLDSLRNHLELAARDAPDRPVSPVMALAVSQLLQKIYRLLSRETGARSLPRLGSRERPRPAELSLLLADTRLALDTFAYTHRDWRNMFDGGWLTREAFLELSRRRQRPRRTTNKLIPVSATRGMLAPVPPRHAMPTKHRAG